MGQVVEPYVPKGSLGVTNEHAPYIHEDSYMVIDPYMINEILIDKCLEEAHNKALEDHITITQLNVKIL